MADRIEVEQREAEVEIDEASMDPYDIQQAAILSHQTVPELRLDGAFSVQVAWSDDDVEHRPLSPYDILCVDAISRMAQYTAYGFETGQWPGGLRLDEHLHWKQAIWIGLHLGATDAFRGVGKNAERGISSLDYKAGVGPPWLGHDEDGA